MSQESNFLPSSAFIVPPFAQRCLEAGASVWKQSFKHPFVVQLIDGSLSTERFRYYQMQDARYLEAFSDVCCVLSTRTTDPEIKLWFIDGARMAILVERSLHENYGRSLGYSADDIAALSLSPNNRAYQNHLLAVSHHGSMLEAIAALALMSTQIPDRRQLMENLAAQAFAENVDVKQCTVIVLNVDDPLYPYSSLAWSMKPPA